MIDATRVILGEAVELDPVARRITLSDEGTVDYDTLLVATGARHAYFGHDEWAVLAPGLKTIEDATDMRRRILLAYEAAEREADDFVFAEKLEELNEELEVLNAEARELEERIGENVIRLLNDND